MTETDLKMCALYREWNAKINVVSRKDTDALYEHHILHSLAIAEYLKLCRPEVYATWKEEGATVLDLGTGGGFPGIPLAVEFPKVNFTLADSVGKKIKVASAVAEALELRNVSCVNARAESLDGPFDWVVSRAVAPLPSLYGWMRGKYSQGLICLKGGDVNGEISDYLRISRRPASSVRIWRISEWLTDPYYEEKFVIEI